MSRRLFWRLIFILVLGTLLLLSLLHYVADYLAAQMTRIAPAHQAQLQAYAQQVAQAQQQQDHASIRQLTAQIFQRHQAWSALLYADNTWLSAHPLPAHLQSSLNFQRQLDWPVHPFMQQVLISIPLADTQRSFVIELPESMHPRPNLTLMHNLLTLTLPMLILTLFAWLLYRHLMRPLEALNKTTLAFANGDLSARVNPKNLQRRDELSQLGNSFNRMADQIERLVNSQRQLLGDLSHELRTPLTRCELALHLEEDTPEQIQALRSRMQREVEHMRTLVENTLTLAWLDSEQSIEREDSFNLATLFDLLCDDIEFEFPGRVLLRDYPQQCLIQHSNQRTLSHSLENILRNALKYSPEHAQVRLSCHSEQAYWLIQVMDQGPGVAAADLAQIFAPFFRVSKARGRSEGGFGLGLALAQRHIHAIGGEISAANHPQWGGLCVSLRLPIDLLRG